MLVSKIIELKDEQAKAFNEANKIYMEAQRMRSVSAYTGNVSVLGRATEETEPDGGGEDLVRGSAGQCRGLGQVHKA